ncbi:hypothetical protein PVAND_000619 [Polypedilum vanderplanki]|uniref:RNA-binding protein cabeza n=1 Tax=Polypedilum vanderplanki TaxID=319348 RepID=A0A9J6BKD2_POLVA|nr:hypothetical protein PVAND_000619 [Polypedilum vanderplanki]
MANQDYNNYQSYGGGQQDYGSGNNYGGGNDYQGNGNNYRGGNFNKGGNFGGNNRSGGYNNKGGSGGDMVVQDDTIFVSGMDPQITESEINNHFGSIGIIKKDKRTNKPKIWIYKDKATGEGKGECTITYDDPCTASSAIEWFDGKEFNGYSIKVQLAQRNNSWQKGGPKKFGGQGGERGGRGGFGGSDRNFSRQNDDRGPRGGGSGGNSGGQHREGDWICSECSNKNFAWRNECNRCKEPKGDNAGSAPSGGGGNRGYGSGDRGGPRNFGNRDGGNGGNRNFNRGGMKGGDRQSSGGGGGGFNRQRPY